MACGKAKELVIEELNSILKFIEEENSLFEKERNDLKASYHGRPPEEKNIVKDVLAMHNEFDKGINKFREIIDNIADIPTESNSKLTKAEEFAQQIVSLQASLINKHNLLQKFLVQKINFQRLQAQSKHRYNETLEQLHKDQYKAIEIKNYDHSNIFAKKVRFLNTEIMRLKELLARCEQGEIGGYKSPELIQHNSENLTGKQAQVKLQELSSENQQLEEEIGLANMKVLTESDYAKMKKIVEEKKKRVTELRAKHEKVNSAKIGLSFSLQEDECTKKIQMLDNIIGRRGSSMIKPTSPKGKFARNSVLLQDIEASISRVKAISSPIPRNN